MIWPISVELRLKGESYLGSRVDQLDESTVLPTGTSIEVVARNDPEFAKHKATVWIGGAEFQPDGGSARSCNTLNTGGSHGTSRASCLLTGVTKSGTLTVTALANGKWKTKSIRILKNQNFVLTPDKPSAFVDDRIEFTATVDSVEVPVTRWRWAGRSNLTPLTSV